MRISDWSSDVCSSDLAQILASVQAFCLDDFEGLAHRFVAVRQQHERKFMLGDEVVVRLHAVARHAENIGAGFLELRVQITEIQAFLGAARRVVLRLEVDDQRLALERAQRSEEHTSELPSLMRISYAVIC